MKGLKIFNIILFSLICLAEAILSYLSISCFMILFSNNAFGIAAGIVIFITYQIIINPIILVLSIILTITTNRFVDKKISNNLEKSKFDKICLVLPWCFIGFNILSFIAYFAFAYIF